MPSECAKAQAAEPNGPLAWTPLPSEADLPPGTFLAGAIAISDSLGCPLTRHDAVQLGHKNPRLTRQLGILVVDDEQDTVQTLAALLADAGHVLHTCTNATFAVDAIRRFKPDVCVLDIVMPRKTGFSIARDVLSLHLLNRPVLIALSGVFNAPKDDIVAKTAGFDFLVRKGAEPTELLSIISHLAEVHVPPAA